MTSWLAGCSSYLFGGYFWYLFLMYRLFGQFMSKGCTLMIICYILDGRIQMELYYVLSVST